MSQKYLPVFTILIYLGTQTLLSVIAVYAGLDIHKGAYFIISLFVAFYYYQTRKYGYFLDPRYFNRDSKKNWKVMGLSVVVYYISVLTINYTIYFSGVGYTSYRFYSGLISLIIAIYFYQNYKYKLWNK